jgi:hypothetical protein
MRQFGPRGVAGHAPFPGSFAMWRSFFWSVGLFACVLGAQCLVVEKAVLPQTEPSTAARARAAAQKSEFEPPDWAPWSLFSFGAITLIYTVTIPNRSKGG